MKIKCGNYEVLNNGVINSVRDEPITFTLPGTPVMTVKVELDRTKDESDLSWTSIPEKIEGVLTVSGKKLNNYGLSEPFKIGTHGGRELLICVPHYNI